MEATCCPETFVGLDFITYAYVASNSKVHAAAMLVERKETVNTLGGFQFSDVRNKFSSYELIFLVSYLTTFSIWRQMTYWVMNMEQFI
jgi:hypothetical protein